MGNKKNELGQTIITWWETKATKNDYRVAFFLDAFCMLVIFCLTQSMPEIFPNQFVRDIADIYCFLCTIRIGYLEALKDYVIKN